MSKTTETQSASSGRTVVTDPTATQGSSRWAFALVVIMLGALTFLLLVLLIVAASNNSMMDYSKWALTTLLGTFGAWIGAGAAYFFGKENLNESSRSTAEALKIQLEALRSGPKPVRIRELALTTMDTEFKFNLTSTKKDVTDKLTQPQYKGYWWVPVFDAGGKLVECVRTRVFWQAGLQDNDQISKIISDIDTINTNKGLRAFHGASFFMQVDLDDEIADVIDNMKKSSATVGIIVDEKGKPIYCFTKQDLLNVQK